MNKPYIITIGGGSGSGKTTLVNAIADSIQASTLILSLDDYYLNAEDMPASIRGNVDHPKSIDRQLFMQHLLELKRGNAIEVPQYDFVTHTRQMETTPLKPADIILLDGILVYTCSNIFEESDLSIFVGVDADIRLSRRILRDTKERGRSVESVIEQYISMVKPMHKEFVEPYKSDVDLVISGIQPIEQCVSMVIEAQTAKKIKVQNALRDSF